MEKKKTKIAVIVTCHNRKEKTVNCVKKLREGNPEILFQFIIVDDGSTDGTAQELEKMEDLVRWGNRESGSLFILREDGNQYWAGGMRKGMLFVKERIEADYCLLVNDDVDFFEYSIEKLAGMCYDGIVVGATCDKEGKLTYGGIRYNGKGIRYEKVGIDAEEKECDTFNANCVLIPFGIFKRQPVIDSLYAHTLGDFDYGLGMKRAGVKIKVTDFYVGCCSLNDIKGTWNDTSLSRRERIRKKEDIKGAPFKQWFYFLKKNFGWGQALVHGFTPYVRIGLGK